MKFTVNKVSTPEPEVDFHLAVDEDGDLMLYANGHKLLFICSKGGLLARMYVDDEKRAELRGLVFNGNGRIELSPRT